jgi:hypothetical protein
MQTLDLLYWNALDRREGELRVARVEQAATETAPGGCEKVLSNFTRAACDGFTKVAPCRRRIGHDT